MQKRDIRFYGVLVALLMVFFLFGQQDGPIIMEEYIADEYFPAFTGNTVYKSQDSMPITEDQKKLYDKFGMPDVFRLTMQSGGRLEIWTYHKWGRAFTFENGEFLFDQEVQAIGENFKFPEFRPTQFKNGMKASELEPLLGKPTATGKVNEKLMENVIIHDYFEQVKVGIQNGIVIFVQTLPVPVEE